MDEDLSIINTNTRNEKIKNFFINNKNKLIFGIIILLVGIVGVYSFDKYQINKKQQVSDTFNLVTIEYSENNKEKTITKLIEIINEKDPTYSPLSLYFIIDTSSSIIKSCSLTHTAIFHHFYNTQAHFWYLFCTKF